jgi:hypothetical protein
MLKTMSVKLNTVLAVTEKGRVKYKNMISNFTKFFSKDQGAFQGHKKTYTPREGTIDDPKKRSVRPVATTVTEKFNWFIKGSEDFIQNLFDMEASNAAGVANVNFTVDGVTWGHLSSLELLRLKSLLESSDLGPLTPMLSSIPVRSDSELWNTSDDENYVGREIYENEMIKGVAKTTVKQPYIIEDPNLGKLKDTSNYAPVTAQRDIVQELGDYTTQDFSGEWSQRQKAEALKRKDILLTAVVAALKEANEADKVSSIITSEKLFGYIFFGR